jgi:hypothetical protein
MVLPLDEIWMTTHFSRWKAICHCFSQSFSAARSCCRSSVYAYWRWVCIVGNHLRRGVPLSWWLLESHWWKLRKAEDRERFTVVLLITLLLLMKYGHRGGLVAVCCWGSPWSIVGFVHALRSAVVCGEASGELQCQNGLVLFFMSPNMVLSTYWSWAFLASLCTVVFSCLYLAQSAVLFLCLALENAFCRLRSKRLMSVAIHGFDGFFLEIFDGTRSVMITQIAFLKSFHMSFTDVYWFPWCHISWVLI